MHDDPFKSAGVELALTQGQGSGTSATLVGQGQFDFGFVDTSAAMIAQAKGVPIQNVLVIQQSGAFATQCWKSANVKTPADLPGHSVLMVPAESTAQVWPAYLSVNHLDPSSIHVVNATVSNKVTLMVAHKADCMAGLLGQDTLQASLANNGIDTPMPWAKDGIQLFGYSLIASQSIIKSNPNLVKSMVAGTIAAWKATCADQPSALALFAKLHPELAHTDADKAYNTGNLQAACAQTNPPSGVTSTPLGPSSDAQWETVLETLKKYGGLQTDKPASAFYTNDFIPTS
jgi:NitT/TauT family transport system substrate-binding protein